MITAKVEHKNDQTFYALFQFADFSIKIFECQVNDENGTSIMCADPCTMKLTSKIELWDVGKMNDDDSKYVWTFVDEQDMIYFYSFQCYEMGEIRRYRANYDIIDVEIQDNDLYILYNRENSKLG